VEQSLYDQTAQKETMMAFTAMLSELYDAFRRKVGADEPPPKAAAEAVVIGDTRFDGKLDALSQTMGQRFDALSQCFDVLNQPFDGLKRELGQRSDALNHAMDQRFVEFGQTMDQRFDALSESFDVLNQPFDGLGRELDQRSDALSQAVNQRLDVLSQALWRIWPNDGSTL
jgi:hypothetical protein